MVIAYINGEVFICLSGIQRKGLILKWGLQKWAVKIWNGFIWLIIRHQHWALVKTIKNEFHKRHGILHQLRVINLASEVLEDSWSSEIEEHY